MNLGIDISIGSAALRSNLSPVYFFGANALADYDWGDPRCTKVYQGSSGELLSDANMEAADTSAWTLGGTGNLSKDITSPHGGSRVLRVTATAGSDWANAKQTVNTSGARFRVKGWARGDGVNGAPRVQEGANILWNGTTSTAWQYFEVDYTASAALTVVFGCNGNAGTEDTVDFDDTSNIELPGFSVVPNLLDGSGTTNATQTTAANRAWADPTAWNGGLCAEFDSASAHYMIADGLAAAGHFDGVNTPMWGVAVIAEKSSAAGRRPWTIENSAVDSRVGPYAWTSSYQYYAQRRILAVSKDTVATAATGPKQVVGVRFDGTTGYVYEDAVVAGSLDWTSASSATFDRVTLGARRFGGLQQHIDAYYRRLWLGIGNVGATAFVNAQRYLMALYGIA